MWEASSTMMVGLHSLRERTKSTSASLRPDIKSLCLETLRLRLVVYSDYS